MTPYPSLTVVVTYYNEGELFSRAMDSILGQDYPGPLQIVVVDDCSTIPIPPYVAPPGTVEYYRTESNSYASAARNLGVSKATGDYIAFLDADDLSVPNRFRAHVDFFLNHPEVVIVGAPRWTHRDGKIWSEKPEAIERCATEVLNETGVLPPEFRFWVSDSFCFGTGAMTIRKTIFEAVGGFDVDLRWGEEWDLAIKIAQLGPAGYVAEESCHYLCRPNSITSTVNPWKQVSKARIHRRNRKIRRLPRKYIERNIDCEHEALLIASQVFLETRGDAWNATVCALKSLRCGPSVWGVRSSVRSLLYLLSSPFRRAIGAKRGFSPSPPALRVRGPG